MATTITPTYGTAYTWSNQALLWSDSHSNLRSWEGAYVTISYDLAVDETLDIAEQIVKAPAIAKTETFAFVEARIMQFELDKAESLTFFEVRAGNYGRNVSESLTIGESASKNTGKAIAESFAFAESPSMGFGLNQAESVAFAESILNGIGYIREFVENIAFAESVSKAFELSKAEAFAVVDAWRRQGDMVISDMMIAAGDMTMDDFIDFMKYGNVPGYEKWRDFIPGDYEYREAMIRVVLESKNADRGLLTDLQATVDVPDLIDRGSATITVAASGISITYNRHFHIVPEITLAARGGTGANPIAPEFSGSPTKTGFAVKLRDTITGAFVTGSFTWAAHGY